MSKIYYLVNAKNFGKIEDEAVLFHSRFQAAANADSTDISNRLDERGEWVYIHKVKLLKQDPRIFSHIDLDDLSLLNGLADLAYIKLGPWSWRSFQKSNIKQILKIYGYDGYTCKLADQHCTILFNPSQYNWLKMNRYDYTQLQDEYKKR